MKAKLIIITILILSTINSKAQIITERQIGIIPQPQQIERSEGVFTIDEETSLFCNNPQLKAYLNNIYYHSTGKKFNISPNHIEHNGINIVTDLSLPTEGYKLSITKDIIIITSSDRAGAFYAIQSLLQLMPATIYSKATGFETWDIPCLTITDSPRFSYRGFMLDVSRTFFGIEVLYNFVDWLSYHKINKFHLHLADDNGWRIEIKKYPELTAKGAWRGPGEVLPATFGSGDKKYGGFYTQKQMKALIRYAQERNIEIIPEIDLPGHSKTFAACFPDILCKTDKEFASVQGETGNVFCVGNEHNYKILDKVIKEIASIFPSEFIHIGGDEVNMSSWEHCSECKALMEKEGMTEAKQLQTYFVKKMDEIVHKYGKQMAGWDEIIEGGEINPNNRVYSWRSIKTGIKSAKEGYPTVMQPAQYCYVDMKQSPIERGHNWAAIVTLDSVYKFNPVVPGSIDNAHVKNIIGTQVGLWTELLNKPVRFIEYQTFPRICASAEVGWTLPENKNYEDFCQRLTKFHYARLTNMGIAFRLPYPDVKYENNYITATTPYKGAVIRFSDNKTNPDENSDVYCGKIETDKPENYRFATFYGDFNKSISVGASNIELHHYINPNATVSSSLKENPRFPLKNLIDNDLKTYFRSIGKATAKDSVVFYFKDGVKCNKITVETGIPNIDFYGVTKGHLEYSYDGKNFIVGDQFKDNKAIILPSNNIKAIKIVIDGPNDGHTLCLQDIRFENE